MAKKAAGDEPACACNAVGDEPHAITAQGRPCPVRPDA